MANDRSKRGKKRDFSDKDVKDRQRAAYLKSNKGKEDSTSQLRSRILQGPKRKEQKSGKSSGDLFFSY